jgi:hypothetical protein
MDIGLPEDAGAPRSSADAALAVLYADPATGAYAFSVAVPAGRYLLEVTLRNAKGESSRTVVDLLVS